jgi:hypothetical protein
MVRWSPYLTVTADSERPSSDVFSLGETIRFGSLEFIVDHFGGLSLSPIRDTAVMMDSTHGGTLSPLWATTEDSVEEFHKVSDGEGRIDLPFP